MSVSVDAGFDFTDPRSYWQLSKTVARRAVWADDPVDQVTTNLVLIAALMLSSAVGFLVGIPLALLSIGLLFVGLLRIAYRVVGGR